LATSTIRSLLTRQPTPIAGSIWTEAHGRGSGCDRARHSHEQVDENVNPLVIIGVGWPGEEDELLERFRECRTTPAI